MNHTYNKELLSEVFDIDKARKVNGVNYNTYFISDDGSLFHIQGEMLSPTFTAFDSNGRIIYSDHILSNCDHIVTINKYDNNGNMIYQRSLKTNRWGCHDGKEKLLSDDETWREYDDHNHIVSNNFNGKVTTSQYKYDELGRVIRRDDSDGEYIVFEHREDGTRREYGQNSWGSFDITRNEAGEVIETVIPKGR